MAKSTNGDIGFLYGKLSLGPEIRSEEPKGKYPKGRIRQVFDVFGAEMNNLMRVNAWFLLYAVPLFIVLYWYGNYATSLAISGLNFTGNLGMAYPGGSDDVTKGIIAVYKAYQTVLYLVIPGMAIMSIGLAGSFNCYKSYLWGEKVTKITKLFYNGVKKHWWKYLIVVLFDSLIVLAAGSTLLWFLQLKATGAANAGAWVLLIAVFIAVVLILYVNMQMLPLICEIDVPFLKQIKNAIIFSIKFALFGLPLFIICLLPIALFFMNNSFVGVLLGVLMLMFGFVLYGLIFTSFSQLGLDNILTPLYLLSINPKADKNKSGKKGNPKQQQIPTAKPNDNQNLSQKKKNGGK